MTPSNLDDMLGSDYQDHGGVLKGLTVPFFAMGGIPGYRQQCHSNASVCKKDFKDPEPHTIFFSILRPQKFPSGRFSPIPNLEAKSELG